MPPHNIAELLNTMAAVEAAKRLRPDLEGDRTENFDRTLRWLVNDAYQACLRAARRQPPVLDKPRPDNLLASVADMPMKSARATMEAAYIRQQLEKYGNISAAARAIGVHREALHRDMKKLGIVGPLSRKKAP